MAYSQPWQFENLSKLALHSTLLHTLVPGHFYSINWAHWSVAVEWQLYLLYPFVYVGARGVGLTRLLFMSCALSLCLRLLPSSTPFFEYIRNLPMNWWMEWMLGVWIADRFVCGKVVFPVGWVWPLVFGTAAVAAYSLQIGSLHWYLALLFFGAIVQNAAFSRAAPGFLGRLLTFVGKCSFSIYLFHLTIWEILIKWMPLLDIEHNTLPGWFLSGVLIFIPTVGISYLAFLYVELPSIEMGRYIKKRLTLG